MARARVLRPLWILLIFTSVTGCGCWQRYQQSPANPVNMVRALFPPDGETFYSDQAHRIDRSLQREQHILDQ